MVAGGGEGEVDGGGVGVEKSGARPRPRVCMSPVFASLPHVVVPAHAPPLMGQASGAGPAARGRPRACERGADAAAGAAAGAATIVVFPPRHRVPQLIFRHGCHDGGAEAGEIVPGRGVQGAGRGGRVGRLVAALARLVRKQAAPDFSVATVRQRGAGRADERAAAAVAGAC